MILPKLPKHWTTRGDIPNVNARTATGDDWMALDEDMLQISDASGQYTIDVGWYPAGSPDGQFVGRIIAADDWERPLEKLETPDRDTLRGWLAHAIADVRSRLGQPGEFSNRVGVFLYARPRAGKVRPSPGQRPKLVRKLVTPSFASKSQNRWHESQSRPYSTLSSSKSSPYHLPYAA
jgi:hypothetical protein